MHLFEEKPWKHSQAGIAGMPSGMLGPTEGALLYHLAKDYFSGRGEIIDAGAFLGSSSYCLAKGVDENNRLKSKSETIHAYDLFKVWIEQDNSEDFMISELKRVFDIDLSNNRSILPRYMSNLGPLAQYVDVHIGDITKMNWNKRPIEILFLDICKTKEIWQHVLGTFFRSLIPGISIVIHQDYHHPFLPYIHVVQERLAGYFDIVEEKADDSAAFLLRERLPDRLLDEVANYDFDFAAELNWIDRAIERLPNNNRHIRCAKAQLLRQHGQFIPARSLIDQLKTEAADVKDDPRFPVHIAYVEHHLARDEAREFAPPPGFDEDSYLAANADVRAAVLKGIFQSGLHHWHAFGRNEHRRLA